MAQMEDLLERRTKRLYFWTPHAQLSPLRRLARTAPVLVHLSDAQFDGALKVRAAAGCGSRGRPPLASIQCSCRRRTAPGVRPLGGRAARCTQLKLLCSWGRTVSSNPSSLSRSVRTARHVGHGNACFFSCVIV